MKSRLKVTLAILALSAGTATAHADVKAGVDAWTQGDFARAVAEWQPLAEAGDPDAQFNMGQAYKLGRGVSANLATALEWYRKAAAQGHARAEDNYGLLLFQQNRRTEAMPWLQRAAERGEPRAQYLVGTALFNGDFLQRDWPRAYALMSRAAAADLPQANGALAQMDQYLSDQQRRDGIALANAMTEQAAQRLADATTKQAPARRLPGPVASTDLPPSAPATADAAQKPASMQPAAMPVAQATTPASASGSPKGGEWRVQLGAFSAAERAEAQWKTVSARVPELADLKHYLLPAGNLTRLQAGPISSTSAAAKLCAAIKASGADCIIKAM
ncbi:MAG: SPOR domain-containing protein [Sphingobium sp.]